MVRSQNFDKVIVGLIGKALTGKRLEGKTLMNRWLFVKFVKVLHYMVLYEYNVHIVIQLGKAVVTV